MTTSSTGCFRWPMSLFGDKEAPNNFLLHHKTLIDVMLRLTPLFLGICLAASIMLLPGSLPEGGRIALSVTVLCITGWTFTNIPDSLVAIAGSILLVLAGVVSENTLFEALGHDMVWLLVAAFIIAAIMKASGLMEIVVAALLRPVRRVHTMFYALAALITLTAFFIPSTSGRAALLLPVFLGLVGRMPDSRLVRPLALLFPTIILLSAGGTLIGAGAHVLATEAIIKSGGPEIGFDGWLLLAFPLAALSCAAATWLIVFMFVPKDLRNSAMPADTTKSILTSQHIRIGLVITGIVAAWIAIPYHGIGIATVAVAGAALLMTQPFTKLKTKEVFRAVELELILFLATATVIASAIIQTGTDKWLATQLLSAMPVSATQSFPFVVIVMAVVALLSHLAINSRSARAAVLVPSVALPLAALGHDTQTVVMLAVLGTGFCQTTMASAKPVAIFGNAECETFSAQDLARLAGPLFAVKLALLVGFALFIWPQNGATSSATPQTKLESQTTLSTTSTRTLPAVVTAPSVKPIEGASCTADELRTVLIATIGERRMWASGWWHVWSALKKSGYDIKQSAVRTVYRAENLVTLRQKSVRLAEVVADPVALASARAACKSKKLPQK